MISRFLVGRVIWECSVSSSHVSCPEIFLTNTIASNSVDRVRYLTQSLLKGALNHQPEWSGPLGRSFFQTLAVFVLGSWTHPFFAPVCMIKIDMGPLVEPPARISQFGDLFA